MSINMNNKGFEEIKVRFSSLKYGLCVIGILILIGISTVVISQTKSNFTGKEKEKIIAEICDLIKTQYVIPQKAEKIAHAIFDNFKNQKYDDSIDGQKFAQSIDIDLKKISGDKHMGFSYNPQLVSEIKKKIGENTTEVYFTPERVKEARKDNFGFKEVRILKGNIGYLDLHSFFHTKYAGEKVISAMNFLKDCKAIIIDLRRNGGGSETMVSLLASYFFEKDKNIHLNSLVIFPEKKEVQTRTSPFVSGETMPNAPLYILTSSRTFSAAESFSYSMKHLGRATIIGETSRGGAHGLNILPVQNDFVIYLPNEKPVNPITKSNWEKIGVQPDIRVNASSAFNVAYTEALKKIMSDITLNQENKTELQWIIELNESKITFSADKSVFKSYAGVYSSNRFITLEKGILYYQYSDYGKVKMEPISEDVFLIDDDGLYKLRFIRENDKVVQLDEILLNGDVYKNPKQK